MLKFKEFEKNLNEFGLTQLNINKIYDNRGFFLKLFSKKFQIPNFRKVSEVFLTSSTKGTIRGMHFQNSPHEMGKIITVLEGRILDLVVDIRKESNNFLKYKSLEMDTSTNSLVVPRGFAHGFQVLSGSASVLYITDQVFCEKCDTGFNYRSLEFDWPLKNIVISEKDSNLRNFGS